MTIALIAALLVSLTLYAVFAGADYGAGIAEAFSKRSEEEERLVSLAMAPVWEANHIWIILATVVLFSAFPTAFSELTTWFHIPITIMLVGVVLRGCSFTFRHYDPFYRSDNPWYTRVFILSSIMVPFMQGVIVAACTAGVIPEDGDFFDRFVGPWWTAFSVAVGLFFCTHCFLLGAVFLVGETTDQELQRSFIRRAAYATVTLAVAGSAVFVVAEWSGIALWSRLVSSPAVYCAAGSVLPLSLLWAALRGQRYLLARVFAAVAVSLIILSWFALMAPFIVGGQPWSTYSLNLLEHQAVQATQRQLIIALTVGAVAIFPSLAYLLLVFKARVGSADELPPDA